MKKQLLLFWGTLFFLKSSFACDVCGCSSGNSFLGLLPIGKQNMAGIQLKYQQFDFAGTGQEVYGRKMKTDQFQEQTLWFRTFLNPRIQLFGYLPYVQHTRIDESSKHQITSVGDLQFNGLYTIFNGRDSVYKANRFTWLTGLGMKLPTGKYQQRDERKTQYAQNFQIGSGAWQLKWMNVLTLQHDNWGINNQTEVAINTTNELMYRRGNNITSAFSIFYWAQRKRASFLPQLGIQLEKIGYARQSGEIELNTSGTLSLVQIGLDIYRKDWAIRGGIQRPVWQNRTAEMPAETIRLTVSVAKVF